MFISPVTENEVENVINKLKGKLSAGFDEIPEVLVKPCSHYIVKPLTHIFNLSFKFGIFPDLMKNDTSMFLFMVSEFLYNQLTSTAETSSGIVSFSFILLFVFLGLHNGIYSKLF
jgi:hypothetical protein